MLRLTQDEPRLNDRADEEPDTLPFPAEAMRSLRTGRLTAGKATPDAVRLAEWALGNAQLKIDELRAMLYPEDDLPPRAA